MRQILAHVIQRSFLCFFGFDKLPAFQRANYSTPFSQNNFTGYFLMRLPWPEAGGDQRVPSNCQAWSSLNWPLEQGR